MLVQRIGVVGDPHLNSSTPASRLDDYPATTIRKLSEIRRICTERGVLRVLFLGDMFHKNAQSISYLNKVTEEFALWKRAGITPIAITGNHELSFEKLESLDKSPLQSLYLSGLVQHLDKEEVFQGEGVATLHGFDYPVPIARAPSTGYNICVAHRFYEYALSDYTLKEKNIRGLGYDLYILGHDHSLYTNTEVGHSIVQRPGSLMRGTSHSYNLTREPSFDIDTFTYDGSSVSVSFERVIIPHLPAQDVFSNSALHKEKKDDKIEQAVLSQQIDKLIAQMDQKTTNASLYSIIDSIDMRSETRILIEKYLTQSGLYRETMKEGVNDNG